MPRVRCGWRSTLLRIRRTVLGLMAGTMLSRTACRARSSLAQWVMCRPLATGSRQASSTICARWRGGNPLGAARIPLAVVGEQGRQAGLLITSAGPPDGGLIALHLSGDGLPPLTGGDGQDDSSPADLIPGQGSTPS